MLSHNFPNSHLRKKKIIFLKFRAIFCNTTIYFFYSNVVETVPALHIKDEFKDILHVIRLILYLYGCSVDRGSKENRSKEINC